MNNLFSFVKTTIGKKYLMALTGIVLSLFVLGHMAGNLLLLVDAKLYNLYGHAIVSNKPLLYGTEIILTLCFLSHLSLGIIITRINRRARPNGYLINPNGEKSSSVASKTMWIHGLLLLVFVVSHLITFKYGNYYETEIDGVIVRDLHRLIVEIFQQPIYVIWYVISLIVLGLHLSHGLSSSIQTLGIHHPNWKPTFEKLSLILSSIIALGFLSQPIYVFLIYKG